MTANEIIEMVSLYREIPIGKLKSKTRKQDVVNARHGAVWLIRKHLPFMTYQQIGFIMGGRDHSTIMYGQDAVNDSLSINDGLFRWVTQIDLGGGKGDLMLDRLSQALIAVERGYYIQAATLLKETIELRKNFLASIESMKADQMLHEQTNQL
jgi:hypothetical protein